MTVYHVVLFRYAPSADTDTRRTVFDRLRALEHECVRDGEPYIRSLSAGHQESRERAGEKWDDGFVMTFDSADDRDYYIGLDPAAADPAHRAFVAFAGPHLAEVAVVDFVR